MNSNPKRIRKDGNASSRHPAPRTDFGKLTYAQLLRRLQYAEYMIILLRDTYWEHVAKIEPSHFAYENERGYASAMEDALRFIQEEPRLPEYIYEFW